MGFFKGLFSESETGIKNATVRNPRDIFTDLLKTMSGSSVTRDIPFDIFYRVVSFQGVKDGVGCSTIVASTALAISRLGLNVCVIDTSILAPCQDMLLKTNYKAVDKKDRVDWMDISHTKKNILNTSKLSSKIGVLSFQDRTLIDLLSSNDNSDIVELALTQLHNKFDIILIDVCHEPSSIVASCLQQCQKVIQIWDNTPSTLENIQQNITNNTILSCPLDKMRYVITSMTVDDVKTDWDMLMKQYNFKHLAHVGLSLDIARILVTGKEVFNYPSESEDVQEFNDCITDVACHLLNISDDVKFKGTFTVTDVEDGKVDGTLIKKLADEEANQPKIIRTLDDADASLSEVQVDIKPNFAGYSTESDTSSYNSIIESFSSNAGDENNIIDAPTSDITSNDNSEESINSSVKSDSSDSYLKYIENEDSPKRGIFGSKKKKGGKR